MSKRKVDMDDGREGALRETIEYCARIYEESTPDYLGSIGHKSLEKTSLIGPYNNDFWAQIGLESIEKLTPDKPVELESSGSCACNDVISDDCGEETLSTGGSASLSSHELLFISGMFHRLFDYVKSSSVKSAFNMDDPAVYTIPRLASFLFGLMHGGGILHRDKWLWEFFQSTEFDGSWPTAVCAVYQGMNLYYTDFIFHDASNSASENTQTLVKSGLLIVSLFRKQHLKNLKCIVDTEIPNLENFREYNAEDLERLRLGIPKEANMLVSLLWKSIETTIDELQKWEHQVVAFDDVGPTSKIIWHEAKAIKERIENVIPHIFSTSNEETLMIRGMPLYILSRATSRVLQKNMHHVLFKWDSLPLQWRGSDFVDLVNTYRLGGLICVVEGDPYIFDATTCTSWCVIRDDLTGILLYKELVDDAYDNKNRMFGDNSDVKYIGTTQITTTDGHTKVSSLYEDGSCYDGQFHNFAFEDDKDTCDKGLTCTKKVLSGLPDSTFLEHSSLKCNALQMVAFAFAAGHQDFKLEWMGDDGHIESQGKEGNNTCNLKACQVLFTKEAMIVEHDVVWRGGANLGGLDSMSNEV